MTIRPATVDDASGITAIYAPIVLDTDISFEEMPPDVAEMARRIVSVTAQHPWLVAIDDSPLSRVAGYAYGSTFRARAAYRWTVETTIYLHPEYRGQGLGSRLYRTLLQRLEELGFHTAVAGIALPNDASVELHRKLGFEAVGIYREVGHKFGRWIDTSWWQRRLTSGG